MTTQHPDPDILTALSHWLLAHPTPDDIILGTGLNLFSPRTFYEAYRDNNPVIIDMFIVLTHIYSKQEVIDQFNIETLNSNYPCVNCARRDLPLHTDYRCPDCYTI